MQLTPEEIAEQQKNEEKVILSPKETIESFKSARERIDRKMDTKLQEIMDILGEFT